MPIPVSTTSNRSRSGIAFHRLHAQRDAALGGELEPVADQVDQHLAQPVGVAAQHERRRDQRLDLELQPALDRLRRQQRAHLLEHGREREIHPLQIEPARLELGDVQDVVEQRQQLPAGIPDDLHIALLRRCQPRPGQQIGEPQHRVHRRADLVADIGHEPAFGLVRCLQLPIAPLEQCCLLRQPPVRCLELELPLLALGDVEADPQQPLGLASAVAQQPAAAAYPPAGAVRSHDAVIVGELGRPLAGQHGGGDGLDPVAVAWVDHGGECGRTRRERGRVDAEQPIVDLVPALLPGPQIDLPGPHAAGRQRQLQSRLAVAQGQRRPLMLGHVDDVAVQVAAALVRRVDDPGDFPQPALLAGYRVDDPILQAVGLVLLLAPPLGLQIVRQVVGMNERVPRRCGDCSRQIAWRRRRRPVSHARRSRTARHRRCRGRR